MSHSRGQFHLEGFSFLDNIIELAMSHRENYSVLVPLRQFVPKRFSLPRKTLPLESTTDPTTWSVVHDELSAHEEVYLADDRSIEPSTSDYVTVTTETLSHEVAQEDPILVAIDHPRWESRAQPKKVGWVEAKSTQHPPRTPNLRCEVTSCFLFATLALIVLE